MRAHHLAFRFVWIAMGLLFALPAHAGFLNGLYSPDGIDVIAVGDSGMIYRSVNGGINWAKRYQGTTPLRAVAGNGLTRIMVGDGGTILRSIDSGGTWTLYTAPGSPNLLDVAMPSASNVFVAGAGGTLLRSTDGGLTWTALSPGTSNMLNCVRFQDATHGWIAGNGGFSARTSNAGDYWSASGPSTPNNLFSVDPNASRIWVVGAKSTCWRSTNDGVNWVPVNLHIDSRTDVRSVTLQSADSVFIAGGGGYIRRSVDDGASWTFLQHMLMGEIGDMTWVGSTGFVCSIRSPSVIRTNDRGNTWLNSVSTTITRNWVQKISLGTGDMRGNALALNGTYPNEIYAAVGNKFYISRDDGETWTQFSTLPNGYNRVNAYVVNPKDSMVMVCAVNPPTAILYTNDGGATWVNHLSHAFGEYGIPIEMHPDKTDTLIFGGDSDVLWRSIDFGKNWAAYGSTTFRSPCDLIVVPESDSSAVLVGDGITGSGVGDLWRSTDGGVTFTKNYTIPGSEVPGMSIGRLRNKVAFATNWSTGGVERTLDTGLSWIPVQSTQSSWGTDVCKEDPNVVVYGVYSGGLAYVSLDGGSSFSAFSIIGSNYSFLARDRNCIIAQMSNGLWKLVSTYSLNSNATQTMNVTSANGGEVWSGGSVQNITWTSANVVLANIEYQRSPSDPWQPVATVPGYYGTYAWTVPYDSTTQARLRVSDAWDSTPTDVSDANFSIVVPYLTSSPSTEMDFNKTIVGTPVSDTLRLSNPGTGTLHISSIASSRGTFVPHRTVFSIPAGASDTVGITFTPVVAGYDTATITITADDPSTPHTIRAVGVGSNQVDAGGPPPAQFALMQNQPNPFRETTLIRYALPRESNVSLELFNLQGQRVATLVRATQPAGNYSVEFDPWRTDRGAGVSAGVYFYRFRAGNFSATKKMLYMR